MTQTDWTLDQIKAALDEQRVEPRRSVGIPAADAHRLSRGLWRVVTIAPGSLSAAQVWEVDEAELMWLMLQCIEASEFVVSVAPIVAEKRKALERITG